MFKEKIRIISDFPEKGISFKDITTLLKEGSQFRAAIDVIAAPFKAENIDLVVGPEARGFVVGGTGCIFLKCRFCIYP